MANYATLKAAIAAAIKQNGNNEITGNLLQQQLLAMVNSLGAGYQYVGIATPDTIPGTPDYKCFYIASTPGTYTNFLDSGSNPLVVNDGEVTVLKYDTAWSKDVAKPYGLFDKTYNITVGSEIGGRFRIGDIGIKAGQKFSLVVDGDYEAGRILISAFENLSYRIQDNCVKQREYILVATKDINVIWLFVGSLTTPGEIRIVIKYGDAYDDSRRIVEVGAGKQFTKVYDAFSYASGLKEKCEVRIYNGNYDLYDEMGGDAFVQSADPNKAWNELNPTFLYDANIVGIGDVTISLEIPDQIYQSYEVVARKLSIINNRGDIYIDNLNFITKNCRYAIHDECDNDMSFSGSNHIVKNCNFYAAVSVAIGIGASASEYIFDNIFVDCDVNSRMIVYFHTWPGNTGAVLRFDNVAFPNGRMIFSTYNSGAKTEVYVNNSWADRGDKFIYIQPETPSYTVNVFDVKCVGTNINGIVIDGTMTNPYPPKFFNW